MRALRGKILTSRYHKVTPEIVLREELEGSLFVDCDNDQPEDRDPMIAFPDPDSEFFRDYPRLARMFANVNLQPKRLVRTPRHTPIP